MLRQRSKIINLKDAPGCQSNIKTTDEKALYLIFLLALGIIVLADERKFKNISKRFLRHRMTTLVLDSEPAVTDVNLMEERLIVDLDDGRILSVPLEWYPRLLHATGSERQNWHLLGNGYAIEWPDIDEHIGVEGLLAGRRSGESLKSLERWLSSRKSLGMNEKT